MDWMVPYPRLRGDAQQRKHIQVDEIWAFCYAKQKNVPTTRRVVENAGDIWTWTAICADCKLVPSWLVGSRDAEYASAFMHDLKQRLTQRVQLTTDGHRAYLEAVESAFGADIDYAMLIKLYGTDPEAETRYSPVECIGVQTHRIQGTPEFEHISTSYVEGQNLTMRVTPTMEAGVTDHVWAMKEVTALMDANYATKPRGPYKKQNSK